MTKSRLTEVTRAGTSFNVDLSESSQLSKSLQQEYNDFWLHAFQTSWETSTLRFLDEYLSSDTTYLDIGAWIGPTTLFAASRCRQVTCLEPDPVAYFALQRNLAANPGLNNICPVQAALGPDDGEVSIGGNGELGNSESTLLVNDAHYVHAQGVITRKSNTQADSRWRKGALASTRMITIDTLLSDYKMAHPEVIKIDVEGGEKLVLPALQAYLSAHQPTLLIALHWMYLDLREITKVVDTLCALYACIIDPSTRTPLSKTSILNTRHDHLLCLPPGTTT